MFHMDNIKGDVRFWGKLANPTTKGGPLEWMWIQMLPMTSKLVLQVS